MSFLFRGRDYIVDSHFRPIWLNMRDLNFRDKLYNVIGKGFLPAIISLLHRIWLWFLFLGGEGGGVGDH
jgi:hypothetical protein